MHGRNLSVMQGVEQRVRLFGRGRVGLAALEAEAHRREARAISLSDPAGGTCSVHATACAQVKWSSPFGS